MTKRANAGEFFPSVADSLKCQHEFRSFHLFERRGGRLRASMAMLALNKPARGVLAVTMLTAAAMVLYELQFAETNAYLGIGPLAPAMGGAGYWLLLGLWLASVGLLFPVEVRTPSDIFLLLYLLGCTLWSASYWPGPGRIGIAEASFLWVVLVLPALAIVLARGSRRRHRSPRWRPMPFALPSRHLIPAIVGLLALSALLGYQTAGADAGFDFDEAVLRRLSGRDSFGGNAVAAYLLQMSVNGLAPYLAFLGGLRKSRIALGCAMGFAVFGFWLLGLKAPVLNVIVLATLGLLLRNGRIKAFPRWLVGALGVVLVAAIVELGIFGESLIAEFGVRRVILVSSMIQVYFIDALSSTGLASFLFSGLDLGGNTTAEFYIGATYFDNEATNANTNAFLHEIAAHGFLAYALVVAGAAGFIAWCDRSFLSGGRRDGFAFAAILGILLVEQAFTTALVSSGVLLCLLLSIIYSRTTAAGPARVPSVPRVAHEV